jgi:hydroxypyruvate isomerase
MTRREFAKLAMQTACTSAALPAFASTAVANKPSFSVMLWALERQAPFDKCLEWVAQAGYQGVELVGEFHTWPSQQRASFVSKLRGMGLVVDAMSGLKAGFADPNQTTAFREQFADQMRAAKDLACSTIILLSGNRVAGLAPQEQQKVSIDTLTWASEEAAKEHLNIVIEPIDLLENPSIYMASVSDAFEIARAVNRPNLRVLYDLYHEQRSFGNLIEKLEKNIDLVGLIHIADVPGRHEPETGEINYTAIYRKLSELRYNRWIAMEYYPTGEPVASLKQARTEVLKAFS